MGHGFMEVFGTDVFQSLDGCRALHDPWERHECSGGVFMENVSAIDNPDRPSTSLRPAAPLYPCTDVARRFWDQCYDWQISYALYVSDSDFTEVFELCASGRRAARAPCFRGLGGDVLQNSKFVTSAPARRVTMRKLCQLGSTRAARAHCIEGAVRNMYRDYVDGDVQASGLCWSLAGARPLHRACTTAQARATRTVPLPQEPDA